MRDALPAVRGVAYLNAGTNGPMPAAAADAMRDELRAQAELPRVGMAAYERMLAGRERARAAAAGVLAADPADLVLTGSTSMGIGLAMAGLAWTAADRVITTTEEHPGVLAPLEFLERRFGVGVRRVDPGRVVEAIEPGTNMVALSHVLWTTGRVLPLPEIAAAAHAVGALLLVDGAQSAGNVAVDAPASGADVYAFSGQKWLLGPIGSGGLWLHPDLRERLAPALPSAYTYAQGGAGELRAGAARFDPGSIDPVALAGLTAAIEWVDGLPGGRPAWVEATAGRAEQARALLAGLDRVRVVDPGGPRSGLVALDLDGRDPGAAVAALAERDVLVRAIPDTPYVRVSVGAWTDDADLARLSEALEALDG